MNLVPWRRKTEIVEERASTASLSLDTLLQYIESFSYNGSSFYFPAGFQTTYPGQTQEPIGAAFRSLAPLAFKSNAVVFACEMARIDLFKQARFMWQRLRNGRPGDLFATPELQLLESPWPGGNTGDLLTRMLLYADIGGCAPVARRPGRLSVLRPDWTTLVVGVNNDPDGDNSAWDVDAEILGYAYQEGGPGAGRTPEFFTADEVAYFCPLPDPEARYRGMSWITPVIREVMADKAMTDHRLTFFENGATPNLAIKIDAPDLEKWREWVEVFRNNHEGAANAYKTLFLSSAADPVPIGTNLQQLDFSKVQGAGETRIAAAARVPPVIAGLSEGLDAATYSNYQQARRAFVEGPMWSLWQDVSGSLARIMQIPGGGRLWFDTSGIPFLRADDADEAQIQNTKAESIKALVDAGFESDSVIQAITSGDFTLLNHTGLFSVQLQPAGTVGEGKGALVQGVPQPELPAPAQAGQNAERALALLEALAVNKALERRQPLELHVHPVLEMQPIPAPVVNIAPAQVTVEPAEVRVEPQITVQPTEISEGAVQVNVQPADVRVETPEIRFEPQVTVEAAPAPDVNVTIDRGGRRKVTFPDGRTAIVNEGDAREITFDDGRTATITELPE